MRRALGRILGVVAALAVASSSARADDTAELEGLLNETVVTTASKSAETSTTAPATVTTVTAEDLRRYGIHSLDEALNFLSLGAWTASSLRSIDVGARGVILPGDRGNHVLLLVDGHQINEPLYGAAQFGRGAGVPMEMIDHIEVILGPGSVLYGSNAMLGVINVITKRAKDFHGLHAVGDTEVAKSWRGGAGVGYEFPLFGTSSELTLMLEYYRQEGPGFSFGRENTGLDPVTMQPRPFSSRSPGDGYWGGQSSPSSYASEIPSGVMRFVSGKFELTLGTKSYKHVAPYDNNDFSGFSYFDQADQYELERHAWIDGRYRVTLSPVVDVTARLYGDSYDYQRYADTADKFSCLYVGINACRLHAVGASRWAGAEVQSSLDWFKNARFRTLLGADGRVRQVASKTDTFDYDTSRPLRSSFGAFDVHDQILGAYLEQDWRPAPWFGLSGGVRLDFDARFSAQVSPRVAASTSPWRGGTLKAVYSQAFRAPSYGETSYSQPDQIVAHNLVPETVRSVEGSVEQKMGAHKILFGIFRSWWSNLIELDVLTPNDAAQAQQQGQIDLTQNNTTTQFRNVASIDNYGFNAGVEGSDADTHVRYAVNVTGSSAVRSDSVNQHPLELAPRIFGNARVSYDIPGVWPTVALAARALATRPADRAFDGGFVPAPYASPQLELRATVAGEVPKVTGLSYRASADWASSDVAPYVVGPIQHGSFNAMALDAATRSSALGSRPVLAPVDTFRVTVGLEFNFDP